ncbi:unnamed protein product [Owenia fusiformis]|uniref:Uncharacterized protein n=1 Tax=Owenia fusiformis TaxID=6347 RepID=A0A8S4NZX1_OWEFU|nr:unnamed protein product [Owenia fusiformis]
MFITNIVGLTLGVKFAVGATGFWGGVFMMVTGGIGICASKMKSTCKIVSLMVLAVILAVLSACIFGAHTTGTVIASVGGLDYRDEGAFVEFPDYMDELLDYIEDYNCTHPYEIVNDTYCEETFAYRLNKKEYDELIAIPTKRPKFDYYDEKQPGFGLRIAFNAILTFFALVVFVASIIASCLSCRAVCCRSSSSVIQVVYVPATGSVQMNSPYSPGHFISHGSNQQQAVSVPPHGQLQPHYVQNQGLGQSQNMTTRFTYQTESSDYNQTQQHTQGADEYTRIQSPPPAYQQYGSNEMTSIG